MLGDFSVSTDGVVDGGSLVKFNQRKVLSKIAARLGPLLGESIFRKSRGHLQSLDMKWV